MQIESYNMVRANAPYRDAFSAATEAVLDSGQLILGDQLKTLELDFAR